MSESWDPYSETPEEDFKPLTREQARQWRAEHPQVGMFEVVKGQWLWSLAATAVAWIVGAPTLWALELMYGAAAIALPSTVMALALGRKRDQSSAQVISAAASFFVWEGVKLLAAIGLMATTAWWFESPSWLAMLVGVVVALKAHAVVAWRSSVNRVR